MAKDILICQFVDTIQQLFHLPGCRKAAGSLKEIRPADGLQNARRGADNKTKRKKNPLCYGEATEQCPMENCRKPTALTTSTLGVMDNTQKVSGLFLVMMGQKLN
ncbi:hypothetical protein Y1Q_0009616 [Alligator mississippiensis]|uniref:Uncharacterized protein n=1 Tax=Alligator mississippiensis TaxID=8496 RepID=A0A151NV20_ALLMI|nr:hypothetical protein Y1Q_0009616 [Alligator mississippiensis]